MVTKQHAIDLFLTFETKCNYHFDARLYLLIAKADYENRVRLTVGFPNEVEAYMEWFATRTSSEFYDVYLTKEEQQKLREGKVVTV